MEKVRSITFFMLVTNRDCMIADYAIRSYSKIFKRKREFGFEDFTLYIYLNCLSLDNKQRYQERWELLPYTLVFDNADKWKGLQAPYPGEKIVSPEGIERSRDDYAESYDELWTTELKKFDTNFVATVDADFEILNTDFYFHLASFLKNNPDYIGASSSYDPTTLVNDTYSGRNIILNERNHTWFCIYKRAAFEMSNISHYYFEEPTAEGKIHAFDSAAYFQNDLRVRHNMKFASATDDYKFSFVHYGATSKNRSLTEKNIGFYRRVFIGSSIGWLFGKPQSKGVLFINSCIRKVMTWIFGSYLNKINIERSTYIYEDDN